MQEKCQIRRKKLFIDGAEYKSPAGASASQSETREHNGMENLGCHEEYSLKTVFWNVNVLKRKIADCDFLTVCPSMT